MSELSSDEIGHGDEVLDAAIATCSCARLLERSIHRFDTAIVLAGVKTVEDARKRCLVIVRPRRLKGSSRQRLAQLSHASSAVRRPFLGCEPGGVLLNQSVRRRLVESIG